MPDLNVKQKDQGLSGLFLQDLNPCAVKQLRFYFILLLFFTFLQSSSGQDLTSIKGKIRSSKGELLSGVTIQVKNTRHFVQSDREGAYYIKGVPLNTTLLFSRLGYKSLSLSLGLIKNAENIQDVVLFPDIQSLDEVHITEKFNGSNLVPMETSKFKSFPQTSGSLEGFIKNMPGVSGNNELSSQYSVRGGNFDENLVYLNDIEVFRPILQGNGQEEGLGFINPDLAGTVRFSAGGFEARYGDRLSSVLDVRYTRPDSISVEASSAFLGSSAALKIPFKNSYLLAGIRLKTNQSLLSRQDVEGSYKSKFSDYQVLYKHDLNTKFSLSFFGNYNQGDFDLRPDHRVTEFGTSDDVLKLNVNYQGREATDYTSLTGAFTLAYNVSHTLNFKWINSVSRTRENANSDLLGWYAFDERDGLGSDSPGSELGRGSYLDFSGNKLNSLIYASELRAYKQLRGSFLEMGLRLQNDVLKDRISEFTAVDSSGYSLPASGRWEYSDIIYQQNKIDTKRISGFLQNTFSLKPFLTLTAGVRANYNSFSHETLISPRLSLMYYPGTADEFLLRFSAGSYTQAPFYRELININGTLNENAVAQRTFQLLNGADYKFNGLGTKLRLTSELYYKFLYRITPYNIQNLKIRYLSDQRSRGYAAGADFSLSGNFAKDLESTFRISLMKTEEDIQDDAYQSVDAAGNQVIVRPGYLRRPADQRLNIGLLFQDRLLQNPTYKVHLNLLYASALPVWPPGADRYPDVFKIPPYKRVDIGFSKDFADPEAKRVPVFVSKYFQSLSLHAEIFNLLNIKNTVSYLWLKDRDSNQYAVPNYLTYRKLNIRLAAKLKSR